MEEEFCPSSEIVFQQVYEDHDLGQVYDVTEEPTTSEHAFAFPHHQHQQVVSEQLQLQPSDIQDYAGGGSGVGAGNVFTVDTSQPHVTEVRIESSDGGGILLQQQPQPSPSLLLQEQQHLSSNDDLDMKWMYRKLKKDFFGAIETNECIKSELRHCQRVLQSVEEDKYFLAERLLLYQHGGGELLDNTSESESESDSETLVAAGSAGGTTAPSSPDKSERNPSGIIITSAFSRKRGFPAMEKKGRKKSKLDSPAYNMDSTNEEDGMMERLNEDEDDDPTSPKENEEDSE